MGDAEEGRLDEFFLWHGIVLYIIWGFCAVVQITTGRHVLNAGKNIYLVHRTIGDLCIIFSLYYEIKAYNLKGNLSDIHN